MTTVTFGRADLEATRAGVRALHALRDHEHAERLEELVHRMQAQRREDQELLLREHGLHEAEILAQAMDRLVPGAVVVPIGDAA